MSELKCCSFKKNAVLSVLFFLLVMSLFICVEAVQARNYDADSISMFAMNSASAADRIRRGRFSVLYRGFGSRKAGEIDKDELLGFRFLLDTPHQSWGLRKLIEDNRKAGLSAEAVLSEAKKQHSRMLMGFFSTIEATKELYENRPGKYEASKAGLLDPESHFLFLSPRIGVARMYGPVVMVVQETRPRGMDLNGIAKDAKYYSVARFFRNFVDGRFRMILADYVADRDEYVIPSYILPVDVSGLIIHSTSPVVIGGRIAVPPPAVRRVYRKYRRNGAQIIDVLDGKDRIIARLAAAPSAETIAADEAKSPEKLPDYIAKAWNDYLKTIRRSSGK